MRAWGITILAVSALGLLAMGTPHALAQGGEALPGLGAGLIPYTPWLVPVMFVTGGITWSVFGWYTSPGRRFDLRRFAKTLGSGAGFGALVFAMAGSHDVGTVSHALLAGNDNLVGPSELLVANGLTFALVGVSHTAWKKIREAASGARGASPQ